MSASKTVLIAGGDQGAGPVGAVLPGLLLRRGHRVRVLDVSPPDIPEKAQITHIDGSVESRPQVDVAMRDVDIVVNMGFSASKGGTLHAIESAYAADVERFIHISSSIVFDQPRLMPLESAPRNGKSAAARNLASAEDIVIAYRRKGMSVPVVRTQLVVGPYQRTEFAPLFEAAVNGKGFAISGRGSNHYQLLDVEDLCAVIHLCLTAQRDLVNDTFNVGAVAYGTIRDDLQAVLDYAGHGQKVTNRPFASSPVTGESITKESVIDTAKVAREIGFSPQYSNAQALIRNYEWYIANMHRF